VISFAISYPVLSISRLNATKTICFAGDDADAHDEMIEEEQQEHDPEVEVKEVD